MGNGTQGGGGREGLRAWKRGNTPKLSLGLLPYKLGVIVSPASCTVQRPEESVHLSSQNSTGMGQSWHACFWVAAVNLILGDLGK